MGYNWLTLVQSIAVSYLVLISYQPHRDNKNACFWSISIKESCILWQRKLLRAALESSFMNRIAWFNFTKA